MDDNKLQVDDDSQVYLTPFEKSVLHPAHVRIFLIVSLMFHIFIYIFLYTRTCIHEMKYYGEEIISDLFWKLSE